MVHHRTKLSEPVEERTLLGHVHVQSSLPEGGNFEIGEIWNGRIWHNKIVPNFAMVFKNLCQILLAPNFAMPVTKISLRIFFGAIWGISCSCALSVFCCGMRSRFPCLMVATVCMLPMASGRLSFLVCYGCYFIQFIQVVLAGELVRHCKLFGSIPSATISPGHNPEILYQILPWYSRIRAKFCPHQISPSQISPNPKFSPSGMAIVLVYLVVSMQCDQAGYSLAY